MDLVEINHQVVGMRGLVRKSKVQTIRKLSRRIAMLRSKKGTEDQVSKNKKRADNLVLEIFNMKKLDEDQVSKFALTNVDSFAKAVEKTKADDELRCVMRIIEHKSIQNSVKVFRDKHPNWQKQIPTLLKMSEIRKKFRSVTKKAPQKQKKTNHKRNESKKISRKKKVGMKFNNEVIADVKQMTTQDSVGDEKKIVAEKKLEVSDEIIRGTGKKVRECEIKLVKLDKDIDEKSKIKVKRVNVAEEKLKASDKIIRGTGKKVRECEIKLVKLDEDSDEKSEVTVERVNVAEEKLNVPDKITRGTRKNVRESEIKLVKLDEDSDEKSEVTVEQVIVAAEDDVNVKPSVGQQNSFFLDFEETTPVNAGQQQVENNADEDEKLPWNNKNQMKQVRKDNSRKKFQLKPKVSLKKPSKRGRIETKTREETALHPSWEAKKKLKQQQLSIKTTPQGKKITFDD